MFVAALFIVIKNRKGFPDGSAGKKNLPAMQDTHV